MFKDKNILVYGAGISGLGVAEILLDRGALVSIYDLKECSVPAKISESIKNCGGQIVCEQSARALIAGTDCLVLSPGVPQDNADVVYAKELGKKVVSEVEIAALLNPGKLIAITGTNGKTTTTTLLGEMLKNLNCKVAVGGNIGQALSKQACLLTAVADVLVAEISSFQLESINKFRPDICAILNITPDHLDRHKTLAVYIETKARIFENQTAIDFLILNYEDNNLRKLTPKSKIIYFSSERELDAGAFVNKQGKLVFKELNGVVEFCKAEDLQILGKHNIENALVACVIAYLSGVAVVDIQKTVQNFTGVEHRIEYVTTIGGTRYYNDSKATNPESTIKALEAFEKNVILLAGGYDKKTDVQVMLHLAKTKTKHVIFFGNAKERFAENALKCGLENFSVVDSFEKAVDFAYRMAIEKDIVLLSPACSSYDRFNNYEQRGEYFKELVRNLLKK